MMRSALGTNSFAAPPWRQLANFALVGHVLHILLRFVLRSLRMSHRQVGVGQLHPAV